MLPFPVNCALVCVSVCVACGALQLELSAPAENLPRANQDTEALVESPAHDVDAQRRSIRGKTAEHGRAVDEPAPASVGVLSFFKDVDGIQRKPTLEAQLLCDAGTKWIWLVGFAAACGGALAKIRPTVSPPMLHPTRW